jgi:hypothetical protein
VLLQPPGQAQPFAEHDVAHPAAFGAVARGCAHHERHCGTGRVSAWSCSVRGVIRTSLSAARVPTTAAWGRLAEKPAPERHPVVQHYDRVTCVGSLV